MATVDETTRLYDILKGCTTAQFREVCAAIQVEEAYLEGASHAARAFSLVKQLEHEVRLPDLEAELRERFPRQFAAVPAAPTKQADKNRQALLKTVRAIWITG